MKLTTSLGAAIAIVASASVALADTEYATSAALDAVVTGGPFSLLAGTTLNNTLGAPDGSSVIMNNGAGGGRVRIMWTFANVVSSPDIVLYQLTGQFGSALFEIAWSATDYASSVKSTTSPQIGPALSAVASDVTVTTAPGTYSGGGFVAGTYTNLFVTFNFAGGAGITLDAVSATTAAPEPGTFALFGLGAAGLGAMAFRRRRKPASSVTKS